MPSIRHGLMAYLVGALSLVWVIGGLTTFFLTRHEIATELDRTLERDVSNAVPQIAMDLLSRDRVRQLPGANPGLLRGVWLQAWNDEGETLFRSEHLAGRSLPRLGRDLPVSDVASSPSDGAMFADISLPDGTAARAIAIRVAVPAPHQRRFDPESSGTQNMDVVLAQTLDAVDRPMRVLAWLIVAITLVSIATVAWTTRWLVARELRPLDELDRQIGALEPDRLDQRVEIDRAPEEIAPVRDQVNLLLARIERAFRVEQEFAANAAHELNTPLAALRATIEVALQDDPSPCPTEDCAAPDLVEALQSSHGLTLRMAATVRALLDLVRNHPTQVAPVDLEALVRNTLEELDLDRRADLRSTPDLPRARGDQELLRRVIHNVVANALEYGSGPVTIELEVAAGRIALCVRNLVLRPEPELASRAFDTFWRGNPARNDPHAGIGLSLCRSILAAHQGTIEMEVRPRSEPEHSAEVEVRITLPANRER